MTTLVDEANELLLWVDVETTGLDPASAHLLQVAAIITDTKGNVLAEPFMEVVQHSNGAELRENTVPFVQEMHDATGLWDRLASGTPLVKVDELLYSYVAEHAPNKRQARLAGSSCRLDLNFLEAFLPNTYQHLHYRSVDVSALAYVAVEWGFTPGYYEKKKTHDALDDIRESLEEFLWIKQFLDGQH